MTRRDPALEAQITAYNPTLNGDAVMVAPQSGIALAPSLFSIASLGVAGTAEFRSNGVGFKTLAVPANGSASCPLAGLELAIGSGIDVSTTTAMAVTILHSIVDEQSPVTKEAARANTYVAYVASVASGRKAIRTPNRFGLQTEG